MPDRLTPCWPPGACSLILQQLYRSVFGAREVGVTLPDWLMGSISLTDTIEIPVNGLFVLFLTIIVTAALWFIVYRSAFGRQLRAVAQNRPMAGAVGINTALVDRLTFGLGCGIAGIAGCAFTMIGSTGHHGRPALYRRYLPGRRIRWRRHNHRHHCLGGFCIAQAQSILEFFMSGSTAKVLTLLAVVIILMIRPQGLFSTKVRH